MNYLSDKVNSFTGDALSGVNEMRRKWKQTGKSRTSSDEQQQQQQQQQQQPQRQSTSAIDADDDDDERANTRQQHLTRVAPPPLGVTTTDTNERHRLPHHASTMASASGRSPLAAGLPFGGDSFTSGPVQPPPPSIGFRTDILLATTSTTRGQHVTTTQEPTSIGVVEPTRLPSEETTHKPPERPPRAAKNRLQRSGGDSSESLYEADAWARLWFPRVMILCLLRMLLFIRKVYEDFHATKVYNLTGQTGFLMISALTLLLPTLVFTLYRVSRYLQLVLPDIRLAKTAAAAAAASQSPHRTAPASTGGPSKSSTSQLKKTNRDDEDDGDEAQLTRALMTSSPESVASQGGGGGGGGGQQRVATPTSGEEGLVTARQSPVGASPEVEFHDSQQEPQQQAHTKSSNAVDSSTEIRVQPSPSPPKTTVSAHRAKLESVNVDKLGDLPDKDTVRVVVGASEQFLHGILFVFWQLKRQVDVMGYLVERACLWRKPAEREKEELARLRTGSDGLEWFQDFYAAFLAILAQVYMLTAYWGPTGADGGVGVRPMNASQLGGGVPLISEAPTIVGSDSARILSSFFGTQTLTTTGGGGGRDVLLVSELVVSSAVILSLLICVRRRDDGPLTLGLSMLGWSSLFAGRIIAIGLGFVHLGWRVMTPLIVLHVLAITAWIYTIALASHNDSPSERLDEAEWDPEVGGGSSTDVAAEQPSTSVELATANELELGNQNTTTPQQPVGKRTETSTWSVAEHLALLSQITTLFAIPSLFYWPIMFNLKLHLRPFKYLVLILIQNFLLIPAIWYTISNGHQLGPGHATQQPTPGQLYLLGAVGACSVVGFIFVSLYVACKPSLTEYFARADELFNEAEQSGIYYEFCSRVFKMADLSQQTFRRLMDQSEELIEERYELVSESVSRPTA